MKKLKLHLKIDDDKKNITKVNPTYQSLGGSDCGQLSPNETESHRRTDNPPITCGNIGRSYTLLDSHASSHNGSKTRHYTPSSSLNLEKKKELTDNGNKRCLLKNSKSLRMFLSPNISSSYGNLPATDLGNYESNNSLEYGIPYTTKHNPSESNMNRNDYYYNNRFKNSPPDSNYRPQLSFLSSNRNSNPYSTQNPLHECSSPHNLSTFDIGQTKNLNMNNGESMKYALRRNLTHYSPRSSPFSTDNTPYHPSNSIYNLSLNIQNDLTSNQSYTPPSSCTLPSPYSLASSQHDNIHHLSPDSPKIVSPKQAVNFQKEEEVDTLTANHCPRILASRHTFKQQENTGVTIPFSGYDSRTCDNLETTEPIYCIKKQLPLPNESKKFEEEQPLTIVDGIESPQYLEKLKFLLFLSKSENNNANIKCDEKPSIELDDSYKNSTREQSVVSTENSIMSITPTTQSSLVGKLDFSPVSLPLNPPKFFIDGRGADEGRCVTSSFNDDIDQNFGGKCGTNTHIEINDPDMSLTAVEVIKDNENGPKIKDNYTVTASNINPNNKSSLTLVNPSPQNENSISILRDYEIYNKCTRVEDWEFNSHLIDVRFKKSVEIRRRIFEKFKLLPDNSDEAFEMLKLNYILIAGIDDFDYDSNFTKPLTDDEIAEICKSNLGPNKCALRLIKVDAINEYKKNLARFLQNKSSRYASTKPFISISKALKPRFYSNNSTSQSSLFNLTVSPGSNNSSSSLKHGNNNPQSKNNNVIKQFLLSNSRKFIKHVAVSNTSYSQCEKTCQQTIVSNEPNKSHAPLTTQDLQNDIQNSLDVQLSPPIITYNQFNDIKSANNKEYTEQSIIPAEDNHDMENAFKSDDDSVTITSVGSTLSDSIVPSVSINPSGDNLLCECDSNSGTLHSDTSTLSRNDYTLRNNPSPPTPAFKFKLTNPGNRPPSHIICKNMKLFFPEFEYERVVSDVFMVANRINTGAERKKEHAGREEQACREEGAGKYNILDDKILNGNSSILSSKKNFQNNDETTIPGENNRDYADIVTTIYDNTSNNENRKYKSVVNNDMTFTNNEEVSNMVDNVVSQNTAKVGPYNQDIDKFVELTLIECQKKRLRDSIKRTSFGKRATYNLFSITPNTNTDLLTPHLPTPQTDPNSAIDLKETHNCNEPRGNIQRKSKNRVTIDDLDTRFSCEKDGQVDTNKGKKPSDFGSLFNGNELHHPSTNDNQGIKKLIDQILTSSYSYCTKPTLDTRKFDAGKIVSDTGAVNDNPNEILCDENKMKAQAQEIEIINDKKNYSIYSDLVGDLNVPDKNNWTYNYVEQELKDGYKSSSILSSNNELFTPIIRKSETGPSNLTQGRAEVKHEKNIPGIFKSTKEDSLYGSNVNGKTVIVDEENNNSNSYRQDILRSLKNGHISHNNLGTSFLVSKYTTTERIEWLKGPLIGKGSFGKVFYAVCLQTYEIIAVKQIDIASKNKNFTRRLIRSLKSEISLMRDISHENVVSYVGFEVTNSSINIFLEYVSGGTITTALVSMGPLETPFIRSLTCQILSGLEYLHERNIIHRDIKGSNILLDENGVAKISDFGVSKRCGLKCPYKTCSRMSFQGSVRWMAPEVIRSKGGYSAKVDIWSLGCVVIEMVTGNKPWNNFDQMQTMWRLGKYMHPDIPKTADSITKSFLKYAFEVDPKKRFTASQMLKHPFADVDPAEFDFKAYKLRSLRRKANFT